MIIIKTPEQITALREGGRRHAAILEKLRAKTVPGITTGELDAYAHALVQENGDTPAFLNYQPAGAKRPFPATLCVSVNDEIVHGIPNPNRVLADGDVVSIDLGIWHDGVITDAAITVCVGSCDKKVIDMVAVAERALYAGIEQVCPGNRVGDIGAAIEKVIRKRYGIVREFSGHGVGVHIHEDPFIPNYGRPGTGALLKPGMVIAIEPMIMLGGDDIIIDKDDWTVKTMDGSRACHVEHTVLVTDDGYEILTMV